MNTKNNTSSYYFNKNNSRWNLAHTALHVTKYQEHTTNYNVLIHYFFINKNTRQKCTTCNLYNKNIDVTKSMIFLYLQPSNIFHQCHFAWKSVSQKAWKVSTYFTSCNQISITQCIKTLYYIPLIATKTNNKN